MEVSSASLYPPDRLLPVLGFLSSNRHLTVGLKDGNAAELGEERPGCRHFYVVPHARVVVLSQCGREDVARPVQTIFELAEHEVAVDGVGIVLKKASKLADRCQRIARQSVQPRQVECCGRRGHDRLDTGVGGVMGESHAEHPGAVPPHAATDNHSGKGDQCSGAVLELM